MFKKKWYSEPNTMECRGHTYSSDGKLLVLPFRKTFNYGENDHWSDVSDDTEVVMYKKYNGFMAAVSNGIVATTGTTNSDYAKLAQKRIAESEHYLIPSATVYNGLTFLFEIVDESDPHIVKEKPGVYFTGFRQNHTGEFHPFGNEIKCTFGQAKEIAKNDKGEGFMVYKLNQDGSLNQNSCKLKSDYYVNMKKLMRMSDKNVDLMFNGDHSFTGVWRRAVQHIVFKRFIWEWKEMTDQERRIDIEEYLDY